MKAKSFIKYIISSFFGISIFLFWWLCHPELISFQEQNQLFLFTSDYFNQSIKVAGGFSDYISDFLIQFYYYIGTGAAILALVIILMQILLWKTFEKHLGDDSWSSYLYSLLVSLMMCSHMMDENSLLTYPIAVIFTLLIYLVSRKGGWICQLILSLPTYWLVGPVFSLQVALAMIDCWRKDSVVKAIIKNIIFALVAGGWFYICRMLWIAQYPWKTVMFGINYYRITRFTLEAPSSQYAIIYSVIALVVVTSVYHWLCNKKNVRFSRFDLQAVLFIGMPFAALFTSRALINNHHDENTHVILEQTYQIRRGDWEGIIKNADVYKKKQLAALETPLSANAINLALGVTHQMAKRMFEFPQVGIQGLLMPNVRDNVSNVTTMEAFWQLGFVNESLRYAFDSQESIPTCKKSGRFMKRMAECNILNGRYEVASKYIDILKKSLFYKDWALYAETCLYNEERIMRNPEWASRLQLRLDNDFLYYYPEMNKMLGQLVLHNRQNQLALDYFMGALLLEGNYQSYVANLPQQPQPDQDPFPSGYRNYIEYMKTHTVSAADAVSGASSVR